MGDVNSVKNLMDLTYGLETAYILKEDRQKINSLKEKIIDNLKLIKWCSKAETDMDTLYLAYTIYKNEGWIPSIEFILKIYPDKLDDFYIPDNLDFGE